jgi:hypothetical protein
MWKTVSLDGGSNLGPACNNEYNSNKYGQAHFQANTKHRIRYNDLIISAMSE